MHDEFSYLLAAQTFAHGRLTNPTPPMWVHFETLHELLHPTYASKYPPGNGLMLAFGQLVFHRPWAALFISMAFLCGLVTWALWAWLPSGWAIAGGLLVAMRLTGSYWTESYMGGTLAAIGGALLVGALARLMKRPTPAPALAFGVGLAILANTRPYEGAVLGISCAVVLLIRLALLIRRGYQSPSKLMRSIALPIALVLFPTFIWMGYYNYRVTGHPLLMPYSLYEQQYSSWSQFLWISPRPEPKYDHEAFRSFWVGWDAAEKQFQRQHILFVHARDLVKLLDFFLWIPLVCCVGFSSPRLLRNHRLRIPLVLLLFFYLGLAFESDLVPHYFAPATVLIFLLATAAVQDISSRFPPGRRRTLVIVALFCWIGLFELPWVTNALSGARFDVVRQLIIAERQGVLARLDKEPGKLLVLIRYGPHHNIFNEWVYNDADIDQSRIVWARAMTEGKDKELLRYYLKRRAWILDYDEGITLRPYESAPHGKDEEVLRYYPQKRAWVFDDEKSLPHLETVPRQMSLKK